MIDSQVRAPDEVARLLTSPASYAAPDTVHAALAGLRADSPVIRIEAPNFDPFWLVTRHGDVVAIERDADLYLNGARSTVLVPADMRAAIEGAIGSPHLTRNMVTMDGAEHRAYRSLTQAWFSPREVKKISDRLRGFAREHVNQMLGRESGICDFVSDVALHYPLHVIMSILGIPHEDEARMLLLTQQLFGARDPELSREAAAMSDPTTALGVFRSVLDDFYGYFGKLTEDRRRNPRDDVASIVANAQIEGRPIPDDAANNFYVLIATAGHDTTSASTAGGMLALARDPELLHTLKADPTLIPAFVEEAIRWVTPVKHFMRTAARETELGGQHIEAGDWLMLSYMSANRDESVFPSAGEFRLDRPANRQLAFGHGAHLCLGQHLAKLEMRVLFEELLPRLDSVSLDGPIAWTQSAFVGGPKRLPIRFKAA